MNKLQINFYDETITVICPTNYAALKDLIAERYYLDPIDVDELVKYYINDNDRISIANEVDYQQALYQSNKHEIALYKNSFLTIFLEVSEQSKLYKREFENSKLDLNEERLTNQEALRKEILEKEKILKEMMEKQENERKERERISKEKHLEEERLEKERLEKERLEKERLEKEILEKEMLRESISKAVIESVNNSIEKIREELIQKTLLETSSVLDKSLCSKRNETKKNTTVHRAYSCNECEVSPIVGIRYRCTECFDYDLCENCEETKGDSHEHPLVKHRVEARPFPFGRGCFKRKMPPFICGRWPIWKTKYSCKLKEMRESYDLSQFTDDKLLAALEKANGNVDEAVNSMF